MTDTKGFDLGQMLYGLVSESDTGREQIEYIKLDLLDNDPNNFYALRDLDKLADNIATCGLQQPIRVRHHPNVAGRFMIVSGHRRRAAVEILAKEDPEHWAEVPCIVDRTDVSPSMRELQLIYANSHTRALTPAETSEQAVRVEKLLYQLKEEGHEFPGRMRDHVAAAVGASTSKLARLKVIRENLCASWTPFFKSGELSESVAYALARMPKQWQSIVFVSRSGRHKHLKESQVDQAAKSFNKLSKQTCKKGFDCMSNRARLEYLCNSGYCPSDCCCNCIFLASCEYSCSGADVLKKEMREKEKKRKLVEKQKEQARIAPTVEYARGVYERWSQAKYKADLDTAQYMRACGAGAYVTTCQEYDKYELHPEKIKAENTRLPFPTNIWPSDAMGLCKAADVLGCSIDWLLGRDVSSPKSQPVDPLPVSSVWHAGDPSEDGEYLALVTYRSTDAKYMELMWIGGKWYYSTEEFDWGEVLLWTDVPEVP